MPWSPRRVTVEFTEADALAVCQVLLSLRTDLDTTMRVLYAEQRIKITRAVKRLERALIEALQP